MPWLDQRLGQLQSATARAFGDIVTASENLEKVGLNQYAEGIDIPTTIEMQSRPNRLTFVHPI